MAPNYMRFCTDWSAIKRSAARLNVNLFDRYGESMAAYKRKDYAAALLIQTGAIQILQNEARKQPA